MVIPGYIWHRPIASIKQPKWGETTLSKDALGPHFSLKMHENAIINFFLRNSWSGFTLGVKALCTIRKLKDSLKTERLRTFHTICMYEANTAKPKNFWELWSIILLDSDF